MGNIKFSVINKATCLCGQNIHTSIPPCKQVSKKRWKKGKTFTWATTHHNPRELKFLTGILLHATMKSLNIHLTGTMANCCQGAAATTKNIDFTFLVFFFFFSLWFKLFFVGGKKRFLEDKSLRFVACNAVWMDGERDMDLFKFYKCLWNYVMVLCMCVSVCVPFPLQLLDLFSQGKFIKTFIMFDYQEWKKWS